MEPHAFKLRLQHLADNIAKDLELLKDYEDALRYEDEPRRRARYDREVERLRRSAADYQREFDELHSQAIANQSSDLVLVGDRLRQMDYKLDALLVGQQAVVEGLFDLRQALLSHYEESQRSIAAAIIDQLDQSKLETLQVVLGAIESNRLPEVEMRQLVDDTQKAFSMLRRQGITLPQHSEIENALSDTTLDVKHKIKLAIPLIPTILDYEAEVELGSGVNLGEIWRELKKKLWR